MELLKAKRGIYSIWSNGRLSERSRCLTQTQCHLVYAFGRLMHTFTALSRRSFSSRRRHKPFVLRVPDATSTPFPIALIGRTNVGKSSLFNALLSGTKLPRGSFRAIVSDTPGSTRDSKQCVAVVGDKTWLLMDTVGVKDDGNTTAKGLLESIRCHIQDTIEAAKMAVFVVDASVGITVLDEQIADVLNACRDESNASEVSSAFPVVLVVNKIERAPLSSYIADAYGLNLGDPITISIADKEGIDELCDQINLEIEQCELLRDAAASDTDEEAIEEDTDVTPLLHQRIDSTIRIYPPVSPQRTSEWLDGLSQISGKRIDALQLFDTKKAIWTLQPSKQITEGSPASNPESFEKNLLLDKPAPSPKLKPKPPCLSSAPISICVLGRPNVGKSTLINAFLGKDRMKVEAKPGTTTDAIDSLWPYKRQLFRLIDTAGVTRGWRHTGSDLLQQANAQTLRAIRASQVGPR